jgi:hypothetical protein
MHRRQPPRRSRSHAASSMTSPAPRLRSLATCRSSTTIDAQAESASSSARNRLVSLRPKFPAGRIVAVSHAVSDTAAARRLRAKNSGLLNARTVPMVTSSRSTAVVDRCSDCRPFACEQPVATGSFSSEPPRSDSHGSRKGRSRVEPWLSPCCGVPSGCRRRSWSRGTERVARAWWPHDGPKPHHELAEGGADEP